MNKAEVRPDQLGWLKSSLGALLGGTGEGGAQPKANATCNQQAGAWGQGQDLAFLCSAYLEMGDSGSPPSQKLHSPGSQTPSRIQELESQTQTYSKTGFPSCGKKGRF